MQDLNEILKKYEAVIGLEIHAQLLTKTKAFSSDSAEYGTRPNTNISVTNLGYPGTLPKHNIQAIEKSMMMGLACQSKITEYNIYARKNYFYMDLPKGYQITQDKTPICSGGVVKIKLKDGTQKDIELTRIHMEEDSGKSIHDLDLENTLVDYNRAGTPLIEIVTEPVIKSAEEAYAFVTEIRKLVRFLEICDGNMEEGSLRCDANVSIMPIGSQTFGTKVEVKNMNSISNVKKAIEHEIIRQAEILDNGKKVFQETRSFDAGKGITFGMRSKEMVTDYRYFPEPDLPPLIINKQWVEKIKSQLPELPQSLFKRFKKDYQLTDYDAELIAETKETSHYFQSLIKQGVKPKKAVNWIMGPIKAYLNEQGLSFDDFKLKPEKLTELIVLVQEGKVSNSMAEQRVFKILVEQGNDAKVLEIIKKEGVLQEADANFLEPIIDAVLQDFADKVEAYKNGKKGLLGLFMGEVMKRSQGKADPKETNKMLLDKLGN